jgi:hypothetical protein
LVEVEQVYLVFSCAAVIIGMVWPTSSTEGVGFGEFWLDSGERFLETVVYGILRDNGGFWWQD